MLLLTGCYYEPPYPDLLTQADSLLLTGDYRQADSLIDGYDQLPDDNGRPAAMLRQLLDLTSKFGRDQLAEHDFSMTDSLCRYYHEHHYALKEARALLFLGNIYAHSGDNPSALNALLKAKDIAMKQGNLLLQAWACQQIGDIYFNQRMLSECKDYYRQFNDISRQRKDTLRMAYATSRMGRLYTIENNIDSTLAYYQRGIELGKTLNREDIVSLSQANLCDIYIQIEEYEEAARLMPHDTLNDENWAFWHYGQNNTDSAIFYFKQMLGKYSIHAQTQNLRYLAQLEKQKGNLKQSIDYYTQLVDAEDSLMNYSQVEDTRKIQAQFNYNAISQERDHLLKEKQHIKWMLQGIMLLAGIVALSVWNGVKHYREKKARQLQREILLRQESEKKLMLSEEQLRENISEMDTVKVALEEARKQNDALAARQLSAENELLLLKNQQIANHQRQNELKMERFKESPVYRKIHPVNTGSPVKLTEEEWQSLAHSIDDTFDHFTDRLKLLGKLSNNDLQICYLIKAGLTPAEIATIVCRSKSAITLARQRMWKKLTGEEGSAAQLDKFIIDF